MGFVFILLLTILFVFGTYAGNHHKQASHCSRHMWRYDEKNQMYCVICRSRPGDRS